MLKNIVLKASSFLLIVTAAAIFCLTMVAFAHAQASPAWTRGSVQFYL